MNRTIIIVAMALCLSGCAIEGVLTGNTGDCVDAKAQLSTLETALGDAKTALGVATALGVPGPIALASAAVNTISGDVAKVQTLVTSECAVATPSAAFVSRASRAPEITLAKAKELAVKDKALAASVH